MSVRWEIKATTGEAREDRYIVKSVVKAADLLEAFSAAPDLSVDELAEHAQLPKPTAFRLLSTLEDAMLVQRLANGRYTIGPACVSAARRVLSRGLVPIAQPVLQELHVQFDHTVNLGVLQADSIVLLDVLTSRSPLRYVVDVGSRVPVHATALGRAILGAMPRDEREELLQRLPLTRYTSNTITDQARLLRELALYRSQGYSIDIEEHLEGVRCVGAAITAQAGVAGAISISAVATGSRKADVKEMGEAVAAAARTISRRLERSARTSPDGK